MTVSKILAAAGTLLSDRPQYRLLVVKSQPVPQSARPKLDVGPFVKLGCRTAAGHGRELCAQSGCSRQSRADIQFHTKQKKLTFGSVRRFRRLSGFSAAIAVLRFSELDAQKQSNSAQKAPASISSLSSSRMSPVQVCSPAFNVNCAPSMVSRHWWLRVNN